MVLGCLGLRRVDYHPRMVAQKVLIQGSLATTTMFLRQSLIPPMVKEVALSQL